MKLTTDNKRIEQSHYILQRLEDQIAGYIASPSCDPKVNTNRLELVRKEVLDATHQLNEAYEI